MNCLITLSLCRFYYWKVILKSKIYRKIYTAHSVNNISDSFT